MCVGGGGGIQVSKPEERCCLRELKVSYCDKWVVEEGSYLATEGALN